MKRFLASPNGTYLVIPQIDRPYYSDIYRIHNGKPIFVCFWETGEIKYNMENGMYDDTLYRQAKDVYRELIKCVRLIETNWYRMCRYKSNVALTHLTKKYRYYHQLFAERYEEFVGPLPDDAFVTIPGVEG